MVKICGTILFSMIEQSHYFYWKLLLARCSAYSNRYDGYSNSQIFSIMECKTSSQIWPHKLRFTVVLFQATIRTSVKWHSSLPCWRKGNWYTPSTIFALVSNNWLMILPPFGWNANVTDWEVIPWQCVAVFIFWLKNSYSLSSNIWKR